jgi:hypothetical protein
MKILADFHHEELYHSLYLLFEKRLGHELYRQIGTDWYDEGYWMVYNHPDTVKQYLGLHISDDWELIRQKNAGNYITFPNENAEIKEDGFYQISDKIRGVSYRAITLQKFKETEFDIIISSMP